MAKKFTAEELAVLESGVEGQPITRVQALENELKELETDKKIMEIEKGLHHLMDEIHPSKREQASRALKTVLGGVKENIKERHVANVERREKIKKGIGEIVKFLREEKAKKMAGSVSTPEFKVPAKYYRDVLGTGWTVKKRKRK